MDPPTAGVMSASPYPTRTLSPPNADGENRKNVIVRRVAFILRARAEITSHFAAGPPARWRGASDELYPGRYVRSEQQSQRAWGPQPAGARRQGRVSASLPLLDDVRHRLRRGASHLPARRSR